MNMLYFDWIISVYYFWTVHLTTGTIPVSNDFPRNFYIFLSKFISLKIDSRRETGNIRYTRRRKTKQKHSTICVGHHYAQTNTNKVNKMWSFLQTIGGKDESNIVLMRKSRNSERKDTLNNIICVHCFLVQ